ncbi:MAG: 4-hydroxythreonine-4-phosphate dehydrogenase PdxA [Candidatus Omnitrophota bacterium]
MPISRLKSNKPRTSTVRGKRLGITMGDPAGVGPEVILKAMSRRSIKRRDDFLVIGSRFVLADAAKKIGSSLSGMNIVDLDNVPHKNFKFGGISSPCATASYEYIKEALKLLKAKTIQGLVTAPISKQALKESGFPFGGHTEILARSCGIKDTVMMFVAGNFRVAIQTRHIPLKEVARTLTSDKIYRTIVILDTALERYFRIKHPKTGICGLNPHAGEGGALSGEEGKIITPAIKKAKNRGINAIGPLPADAVFYDVYHGKYDAVISMYHDQGLGPFKMLYRDTGVNVTLGLPFVRTSPDHGTAFDIAGKGIANPSSMIHAINLASNMLSR